MTTGVYAKGAGRSHRRVSEPHRVVSAGPYRRPAGVAVIMEQRCRHELTLRRAGSGRRVRIGCRLTYRREWSQGRRRSK